MLNFNKLENLFGSHYNPSLSIQLFTFSSTSGSCNVTAPIPSNEGPLPVRRWPAVTLHDPDIEEKVNNWMEREGL